METKPSMEQLKLEYNLLQSVKSQLTREIENLRAKNARKQLRIRNQNIRPYKIATDNKKRETKSLDELKECLDFSVYINQFMFSNENIELLPPSDEDNDKILYKKLYQADCHVMTKFTFHIEFLVHEMLDKNEVIKAIDIRINDQIQSVEMQEGLNALKKRKKLRPIYDAIKQYLILDEQRENVLNILPREYFRIEREKDGGFSITAAQDLFNMLWALQWKPALNNYMHTFEITMFSDDEWLAELEPQFKFLCSLDSISHSSSERRELLQTWFNIIDIVKNSI